MLISNHDCRNPKLRIPPQMLNSLKRFFGIRPKVGVSIAEAIDLFETKFPGAIRRGVYESPKVRCSKWLVVRGPVVGSKHHRGTLLVEAKSIEAWAKHHAGAVWSTVESEQGAREYLPTWLEQSDPADDSVSIPDKDMLSVLQGYDEKFINDCSVRLWCPDCRKLHDSVDCGAYDNKRVGKISTWVSEWRCPEGHVVHNEDQEIRWIIR